MSGLAWAVRSRVKSHQLSLRDRSVSMPLLSTRRRRHTGSPPDGLIWRTLRGRGGVRGQQGRVRKEEKAAGCSWPGAA